MQDTGSATGVIAEGKKGYSPAYFVNSDLEEVDEINEHGLLIPARKSLSLKQHLGSFSPDLEFENLNDYSVSLRTGKREESKTVGNPRRLVWKSDTTLLRRGNPFSFSEETGQIKRQTSKSKRIKYFRKSEQEANKVLLDLEAANTPKDDLGII